MTKPVENESSYATPRKSKKDVRFSNHFEVLPSPVNSNPAKGTVEGNNLVRGKRFMLAEDEIIKAAVNDYILSHDLGDEGLDMVLNCRKHPEVRGCWKEIESSIPHRPTFSVYRRTQILFRRSPNRKWTEEEYEEVLKFYEEHDRIKLVNRKKGHWSQDEYQKLFDLVNIDLQAKLGEEKKSQYGMLRGNIFWTSISDKLSTRTWEFCCKKWYKKLTSSMVAQGVGANSDDYRLISGLYSLDATCVEDVDWDGVVEGRDGKVFRKRWNRMALHLGRNGHKPFAKQVEISTRRYCPHLLEAREAWDSKPRVP
ncbi:myb family transcription factor [Striga hermonthica]|uniref:Myb family transcription factor n=1 Tax=Striga hermonthica TaxID=68872 RepID=A0A9N7MS62_STRHE|nr:myb family transcription factor [Striga hermonthica]